MAFTVTETVRGLDTVLSAVFNKSCKYLPYRAMILHVWPALWIPPSLTNDLYLKLPDGLGDGSSI